MFRDGGESDRIAVVAVLIAGAALRVAQWAGGASLWLDEILLARNILERDLGALVGEPLASFQVAPAGFLILAKLATLLFGDGERALRLVTLLGSLAALVLFWRVATRFLAGLPLVAAVAVCAASPGLIDYGSQVKQHATDATAVLALLLLALRHRESPDDPQRAAGAGLGGALIVLCSYPALLAAAGLGLALVLEWLSTRSPRSPRPLAMLAAGWLAGALVGAALARGTLSPEARAYMHAFWADAFPPPPWRSLADALWLPGVLHETWATLSTLPGARGPLSRGAIAILVFATVGGAVVLARRRPWHLALVAAPIVAALTAAASRLLPFRGRVAFWCAPLLVLVTFCGLAALRKALPGGLRPLAGALIAAVGLVSPALVLATAPPFPWTHEDSRPVLARIARDWRAGDALYVYYGGRVAARFYGPRVGLREWTEGDCHRQNPRAYWRELDRFRGRPRLWVFWTHAIARLAEPEAIRSYLGSIGREVARFDGVANTRGAVSAQALLYDLSDPERLARSTADDHALPAGESGGDALRCPPGSPGR